MPNGKTVIIDGIEFASQKECREHTKEMMARAYHGNKVMRSGFKGTHAPIKLKEEIRFLGTLIKFHPNYKEKCKQAGGKVVGLAIAVDPEYGKNRCLWLSTKTNPTAARISVEKAIKAAATAQAQEKSREERV